jgi:cell shape-determining protein MreC
MTLVIVALLIFFSVQGALGPFESVLAVPLDLLQRLFGGATRSGSGFAEDVAEYRRLRQRNQDLEEAAAIYQARCPA